MKVHLIIMMVLAVLLMACGGKAEDTGYFVEGDNYVIRPWPNGEIPYYFDESFTEQQMEAMRTWMMQIEVKCEGVIAFVETDALDDHVCHIIRSSDGNYARMGYSRTSHLHLQDFRRPYFKHEMFHVIGFEHEWKRPDRDEWITVRTENLDMRYENNAKISHALLYEWENYHFDLESISIFSYGPRSLSKNGGVVFEGMTYMGDGNLSDVDAERVVEIYGK